MKRLYSFIIVLFSLELAIGQWMPTNGPEGGTVTALFGAESTLYAGINGSFLYSKKIDGFNWMREKIESTYGTINVTSFCRLDTFLFAGSLWDGGILRKSVHDSIWHISATGIPNGERYTRDLISVRDSLLFASVGPFTPNIYYSADTGKTWIPTNFIHSTDSAIVTTLEYGQETLFAGTDKGIFVSTDFGQSWNYLGLGGYRVNDILLNGFFIFASTFGGGLFRSQDGGNTWEAINNNLPNLYPGPLALNGSRIFVGTHFGIFYSDDLGITWIKSNPEINYITDIFVFKNIIYAGNLGQGIFSSKDNGINFTRINQGLYHRDVRAVFEFKDSLYAICVDADEIFTSPDKGESWDIVQEASQKIQNGQLNGSYLILQDSLILARDNALLLYDANSHIWQSIPLNYNIIINSIKKWKNLFFLGTSAGVFVSADNLNSWDIKNNNLPQDIYITSIDYIGNFLYAGSNNGQIYLSVDSANSWNIISNGISKLTGWIRLNHMGSTLFAAGNYVIYATNDNGANWNKLWESPYGTIYGITDFLVKGDSLFLGLTNGEIYFSPDLGDSWFNYKLVANDYPPYSIIPSSLWASNDYLFLGTYTTSVWKFPLSQLTSISSANQFIPSNFILEQNFPNPFNPITTIEFYVPEANYITLSIYNSLGQKIKDIIKERYYTQGTYSVQFDGSALPSGIYFYQLSTTNVKLMKKMVLLK